MVNRTAGCEMCRIRIHELLSCLYGEVSVGYDLALPAKLGDYKVFPIYPVLAKIHQALQRYCGYAGFVMTDKLPGAQYFVHKPAFIVSFDDNNRLTLARAITLAYYPDDLELGFMKTRWAQLARSVNYGDNERSYRNEQTAWYDTLFDFSSAILDFKPTVRLANQDQHWCALDAGNQGHLAAFQKIVERR